MKIGMRVMFAAYALLAAAVNAETVVIDFSDGAETYDDYPTIDSRGFVFTGPRSMFVLFSNTSSQRQPGLDFITRRSDSVNSLLWMRQEDGVPFSLYSMDLVGYYQTGNFLITGYTGGGLTVSMQVAAGNAAGDYSTVFFDRAWSDLEKVSIEHLDAPDPFGGTEATVDNIVVSNVPPLKRSVICPGDVDGDNEADIVAVDAMANVMVRALDGTDLGDITYYLDARDTYPIQGVQSPVLLPDSDGNGAAELAILGTGTSAIDVRDLKTGERRFHTHSWLQEGLPLVNLHIVPDHTGDGVPEYIAMSKYNAEAHYIDERLGDDPADVSWGRLLSEDFEVYPDLTGDGVPEWGAIGRSQSAAADRLQVYNPVTGALVRDKRLNPDWHFIAQELVADINGNGSQEIALLRAQKSRRKFNIMIIDSLTLETLSVTGLARKDMPDLFTAIPDVNGNGADELMLLGRNLDTGSQKVVIVDSATGTKLSSTYFDKQYYGVDIAHCRDVDGDGTDEIALLGYRESDGRLRAILKDALNGTRVGKVDFIPGSN